MLYCPYHRIPLKPLGISLVCPRCDYKRIKPEKDIEDELRWQVFFPREYAWSTFTTTNVSISGDTASIDTGETEGTLISPQITNLNVSTSPDRRKDITKAKIPQTVVYNKNDGRIRFHVSNDGGTTWTPIKDNGRRWLLNTGNESAGRGRKQAEYNDLRFKITLWRPSASDTSPDISYVELQHNYVPDRGKRTLTTGIFLRR